MKEDEEHIPWEQLIGAHTIGRPYESWYAFVCRLVRANLLNDADIRRELPAEWVRWAFAPHEVQSTDIHPPDSLREQLAEPELKFNPALWQAFPELSSTPPECLRICPQCIAAGTHSYAMQSDLLEHCPVHGDALVHRCPHCETPLLWRTRSCSQSAFCCPKGCSLQEGAHSGLYVPNEGELANALQAQRDWVKALQAAVIFVSGPVHIAYPPYLAIAPLRMPPLPSSGLGPAFLRALQGLDVALPAHAAHHALGAGQWVVEARPWISENSHLADEGQMEGLRRSFRRGAYRTHLPLLHPDVVRAWLARSEAEHGAWSGGGVEQGQYCSLVALDSFLITNNEVTALRRLLARGGNAETACAHYEVFLLELLDHARRRRVALDHLETPFPEVRVAEAFDAIVQTAAGRWRVSGRTEGRDDSRSTWMNLREQAEMGAGTIYISRRFGPR